MKGESDRCELSEPVEQVAQRPEHDNELLPLDMPDWQRQIPDSDGEYPLDPTRDEITWDCEVV
eukprot:3560041-Amphidinium_carterae.1